MNGKFEPIKEEPEPSDNQMRSYYEKNSNWNCSG
jgi:hypothetical protein